MDPSTSTSRSTVMDEQDPGTAHQSPRQSRSNRRTKKKRAMQRANIAESLQFPLPGRFNTGIKLAQSNQVSTLLPAGSHFGIPNPDYDGVAGTPRYAAFRLSKIITIGQRAELHALAVPLLSDHFRSSTIPSNRSTFHGWWNDVHAHPKDDNIANTDRQARCQERQKNVDQLLRGYDSVIGQSSRSLIGQLDQPIAQLTGVDHRQLNRLSSMVPGEIGAETQQRKPFAKNGTSRNGQTRPREHNEVYEAGGAISFRLGGMGTVLAMSNPTASSG